MNLSNYRVPESGCLNLDFYRNGATGEVGLNTVIPRGIYYC